MALDYAKYNDETIDSFVERSMTVVERSQSMHQTGHQAMIQ